MNYCSNKITTSISMVDLSKVVSHFDKSIRSLSINSRLLYVNIVLSLMGNVFVARTAGIRTRVGCFYSQPKRLNVQTF